MITREIVRHPLAVRNLEVSAVERLTAILSRVSLVGPELEGFEESGTDNHLKLFFPDPATGEIAAPRLTAEGMRPPEHGTIISRDYTPRRFLPATPTTAPTLQVDFVTHGDNGPASAWVASAKPGDRLVVAGPRASRRLPVGATRVVLGADPSAFPAMARMLEQLSEDIAVEAIAAVDDPAELAYFTGPSGSTTVRAVGSAPESLERAVRELGAFDDRTFLWFAGEATALIPVRRYLRRELNLPKDQVAASGYWKLGTAALDHHAPLDPSDPD